MSTNSLFKKSDSGTYMAFWKFNSSSKKIIWNLFVSWKRIYNRFNWRNQCIYAQSKYFFLQKQFKHETITKLKTKQHWIKWKISLDCLILSLYALNSRIERFCEKCTMYMCIEVAIRGVPLERGVQLDLGEGPIRWVQCPNTVGTISPAAYTLAHTCTLHSFSVANFILGS